MLSFVLTVESPIGQSDQTNTQQYLEAEELLHRI